MIIIPLNMALQRRKPADLGLRPDGDRPDVPGEWLARRAPAMRIVDATWAATDWTLARAARKARFWCFSVGFFLALFAWYAIQVHQTKYLQDLGFDRTFAAFALGLVPLFGVAGQILLGALADRIGREWIWTLACAGFFACYGLCYLLARNPDPVLVWAMVIVQGFLGHAMTPAIGAIPADLFQGASYGRIFGVAAVLGSAGAAIGPLVFGIIHDRTGSYDQAFLLAMAATVASAVLIWLSAPRKVRRVARPAAALPS